MFLKRNLSGEAQAKVIEAAVGVPVVAVSYATAPGVVVPTATTAHAARTLGVITRVSG